MRLSFFSMKVMDRVDASSSFQPNSEFGIEGLLYKADGEYIPLSLKKIANTASPKSVVSKIESNAGVIQSNVNNYEGVVKLNNPNTIIDIELPLISKSEMLDHLLANPGTLGQINPKTFKEIVIQGKDGGVIIIDELGNIIN